MGMYDHLIDLNLRCPYCDSLISLNGEIQTKDLDCSLLTYYIHHDPPKGGTCLICMEEGWRKEDKKNDRGLEALFGRRAMHTSERNLRFVHATGSCRSPACKYVEKMRQIVEMGYTSGFGRNFYLRYKVDRNGRATGNPEVETEEGEPVDIGQLNWKFNAWLDKNENAKRKFRSLLGRFNNYGIAVLMFSWLGEKLEARTGGPGQTRASGRRHHRATKGRPGRS